MRDDFDVHGTQRIYVTRLGPLDVIVLGLLIALIAALTLIVLLGAVLFWIPAVVLLVAAAVVSKLLRRSSAEAGLARPSAETTDVERDERAAQLVDRLSLWSGAVGLIPVPLVDMAAVGGVQLYMVRRTRRPRVIVVSQSQHARITAKNFDLVLTAQRHLVHPSGAQSIRDKWPVHGEQDSIDTKLHHRAEQCHPLARISHTPFCRPPL